MSRSFVTVLFLVWAGQATAADLRSELSQCRGIQSLAQRLQCYDRLVDGLPELNVTSTISSPAAKPSPAPAAPAAIVNPETPSGQVSRSSAPRPVDKVQPEELFGKSDVEVKETVTRKLEIETVDQISSKVTRIQISPSREYVVYLENGQVWRQKDDAGKWRIKVGETAIISKAALGSFLMKSDARKKSVRAERLR